jgi:SAM-dependent methyltransferase
MNRRLNTEGAKLAKSDVWIRHVLDETTQKLVSERNPEALDVCEISGDVWSDMFPFKSYCHKDYPEFDVCKDAFDKPYGLIIAEQVFEHIRYPWRAAKNIFDGLRPGGYALITTPFIFHIHPTPLDCWRWTPQGMGFMLEDAGFSPSLITTGGWGNYECFLRHAIEQTAPAMSSQFSISNVPHIPNQVWGFAKKV